MLLAPNEPRGSCGRLNHPTTENPGGYHRLIGGGVELGEWHSDAIVREVDDELHATIRDLCFLTVLENIFRMDGALAHEIVFLYSGRLDPQPSPTGATLTEGDGSVNSVVWRSPLETDEEVPLYRPQPCLGCSTSWIRMPGPLPDPENPLPLHIPPRVSSRRVDPARPDVRGRTTRGPPRPRPRRPGSRPRRPAAGTPWPTPHRPR